MQKKIVIVINIIIIITIYTIVHIYLSYTLRNKERIHLKKLKELLMFNKYILKYILINMFFKYSKNYKDIFSFLDNYIYWIYLYIFKIYCIFVNIFIL